MKKSVWKIFLALVFVTVTFSGCAPASMPTPAPSTSSPSPIPPTVTPSPIPPTITPVPTLTATISPDSSQLSIANTQTIEFLGKKFELWEKATDQPIHFYEYLPSGETLSDWIELVDFQINPVNSDGNDPMDFANRTVTAFIQQYPDTQAYEISPVSNSDAIILDLLYPTATRQGFLEFDAYKYYRDPNSSQVILFHYAKNIAAPSLDKFDDWVSEFRKTREEVISALEEFPLYSK